MIKELEIARKLKECNEVLRRLCGDEFEKAVFEYKRLIKAAMAKHKLTSEIEASIKLVEEAKGMNGTDMFTVKIFAACVELMEGR